MDFHYCNEIDLELLELATSVGKFNGWKFLYNGDDLLLHTPPLKVPNRIFERKSKAGKIFKKCLVLSLKSDDSSSDESSESHVKLFTEFLKEFDKKCFSFCLPPDAPDGEPVKYCSIYTEGSNGPTFSVDLKIGYNSPDDIKVDVFGPDNQPIEITNDPNIFLNHTVECIVRFDGIWKSVDKIGINWTAVQIKICGAPKGA